MKVFRNLLALAVPLGLATGCGAPAIESPPPAWNSGTMGSDAFAAPVAPATPEDPGNSGIKASSATSGSMGAMNDSTTSKDLASIRLPLPEQFLIAGALAANLEAAEVPPVDHGEGDHLVMHFLVHVDVFMDGAHVSLPAGLGLLPDSGMAALHTHTGDGIVHVAGAEVKDYTLGQLVRSWGVDLSQASGVYSGGMLVTDPASHVLTAREQIAVVFGTAPATIPSGFPDE